MFENINIPSNWDAWYIGLAQYVATRSKDNTKVGAVVVRPDHTPVSFGYNGLPPKINDEYARLADPDYKPLIIHAEENAIHHAREDITGYTMYVSPLHSCAHCAAIMIKKGIVRIVIDMPDTIPERWENNFKISNRTLWEKKISVELFDSGTGTTVPLIL